MFYVSHATGSVRKMCDRVLVLDKGVLAFDGPVDEGIKFLHYDDDESDDPELTDEMADEEHGRGHLRRSDSTFSALDGVSTGNYRFVVTQKPYRPALLPV